MKHYFYTGFLLAAMLFASSVQAAWAQPYARGRNYQPVPQQEYQPQYQPEYQPQYQPDCQTVCQPCQSSGQLVCQPVVHSSCQTSCQSPCTPACDCNPCACNPCNCQPTTSACAPACPCNPCACDPCNCQPANCYQPCQSYCEPMCEPSCCNSCGTFGFFGKFLWWDLYGEQLDYGTEASFVDVLGVSQTNSLENFEHTFNWKPGVRLGAFYQTPCGGPDVTFEWTYYRNSNSETHAFAPGSSTGIIVESPYLPPARQNIPQATSVVLSSDFSFDYNHFLLKYGSVVTWTQNLAFHPYTGPVYYETNENISVEMITTESGPTALFTESSIVNTKVRAVGAKIGADCTYALFGDFKIIADFGLTGVAADYSLNQSLTVDLSTLTTSLFYAPQSISKWQARALLDLSIGLQYTTTFCGFMGFAQIEWEYHQLFDQTQFLLKAMDQGTFGSPTAGLNGFVRSTADLMMQGLAVTVGFAF